jgi:hypothetical protein
MGLDFKLTSDIAICKVREKAGNYPHQPLAIIQSGIVGTGMGVGSHACALGYAGMADFDIDLNPAGQITAHKKFNLHGSTGKLIEFFPDNFVKPVVSTPGPCFSFGAKIPGGMSGGPIFDREGIFVHGVISRGWEDESGPERFSFGSMLRPSMGLPISRMKARASMIFRSGPAKAWPCYGRLSRWRRSPASPGNRDGPIDEMATVTLGRYTWPSRCWLRRQSASACRDIASLPLSIGADSRRAAGARKRSRD